MSFSANKHQHTHHKVVQLSSAHIWAFEHISANTHTHMHTRRLLSAASIAAAAEPSAQQLLGRTPPALAPHRPSAPLRALPTRPSQATRPLLPAHRPSQASRLLLLAHRPSQATRPLLQVHQPSQVTRLLLLVRQPSQATKRLLAHQPSQAARLTPWAMAQLQTVRPRHARVPREAVAQRRAARQRRL